MTILSRQRHVAAYKTLILILCIIGYEIHRHLEVLIDWEWMCVLREAILRIIVRRMFDVGIALYRMQPCILSCLHGLRQEVLHQCATTR